MDIEIEYSGKEERLLKVKEQESNGLRMVSDTFDSDWERGEEPRGTMVFTDEPAPITPIEPSVVDLIKAEIDDLKARIEKLEGKR